MKINEFHIGQSAQIKRKISKSDIDRFADLTGDNNPLHVDEEYASKTNFKKPVAHGMLGASFISTIIGTKIPGDGALWFSQSLEFLLPVRIGDEITVKAEVLKIDKRQNILELSTDIFNQHKNLVTKGVAKVKLIEQKEKKKEKKSDNNVKTVLVVGASGGIGKELTSRILSSNEYKGAFHSFSNRAELEKMLEMHNSKKWLLVEGDISDPSATNAFFKEINDKLGGPHIVVNCATGPVPNIDFAVLDWSDFERQINVHIRGFFNLMKSALPFMQEQKYGNFINITTQSIEYPFTNLMTYNTAKAGLFGLSKSAAIDLAKKGIRVNMVSPGITDTDLNADLPEKVKLVTEAKTPLKRLALPSDVVNAIEFLMSDKSSFLTGETIRVNGGQIMI